jgi:hypothetical protein
MAPLFSLARSQALSQASQGSMGYGTQSVDLSQIQQGFIRATQVPHRDRDRQMDMTLSWMHREAERREKLDRPLHATHTERQIKTI